MTIRYERLACEVVPATPSQRYRAALKERDGLTNQLERLRRQLDPMTHESGDSLDRLRKIEMARVLLPGVAARLANAIARVRELRPPPPPRPRRAAQPVVWLSQPPTMAQTRDMEKLHFRTGEQWLAYCRRGGRP